MEIEVDSLDGLRVAIDAGADAVLLDNFDLDEMRAAVAIRDESGRSVVLEASGGLTLEVARQVGETGVDHVAVGELTHSARVLDLGLDLREVGRRVRARRRRSATMTTSVSGVSPESGARTGR